MLRFVHCVALSASILAIFVAIGRNYSLWAATKSAAISYLAFYIITAVLLLVYRGGVLAEFRKNTPAEKVTKGKTLSGDQSAKPAEEASVASG